MERIKELREICQAPHRELDNWHMKHIARKPSIYITWILLHTPITANGATLLMVVAGLISVYFFSLGTRNAFFVGALILQFWYIMDMVDGEIARYRKQSNLTGIYFDYLSHYMVHPLVFFGIGLGLYNYYGRLDFLLISLLAAYSVVMITILLDVFNSVLYEKSISRKFFLDKTNTQKGEKERWLRKLFSILHLICTFPTIMNIIFLVSITVVLFSYIPVVWFLKFYATAATAVWISRAFIFIVKRKADFYSIL